MNASPRRGGTLTVVTALMTLSACSLARVSAPRRKRRPPMVVQVKFQPLGTYGEFAPEPGTGRRRGTFRRKAR